MTQSLFLLLSEAARQLEEPKDAAQTVAKVTSVAASLKTFAAANMKSSHDAVTISLGVKAALAAIELDPAIKALDTAIALVDASKGSADSSRSIGVVVKIAQERVVAACSLVFKLPAVELVAAPPATTAPIRPIGKTMPDPALLRNIATYHREHERFYTYYKMKEAVDLCVESNRLKTVATLWLDEAPAPVRPGDYSDPRFQAAGCADLNALRAIASIGVLFMEGEQEPSEIRAIKGKLTGLAPAWAENGAWLAEKMETAWIRESILLRDDAAESAEPRFGTIVTNWRGSRHTQLSGQCLNLALEVLASLDLRPASIRAKRRETGRRLLDAAWIVDQAVQVTGKSACELGENEMRWTKCLDLMELPQAAE